MQKSGRVTIVIPTFNRSQYLTRCLRLLRGRRASEPFHILVLDGSTSRDERKANAALCAKLKVEYRHYRGTGFHRRVAAGLKTVTSDYIQLLGDDDLISHRAISACADFLDAHPDYSACRGHHVLFRWPPDDTSPLVLRVDKNQAVAAYEQDSIFERLYWAMFDPYSAAVYALHRTRCLAEIFARAARCAANRNAAQSDYFVADPLMLSLVIIAGKVGNIQMPTLLREIGLAGAETRPLLGDELLKPGTRIVAQYVAARREMLAALPDGIDREAASDALDAVWGLFISMSLAPQRIGSKLQRAFRKMNGTGSGRVRLYRRNKPNKGPIRDYPLQVKTPSTLEPDELWVKKYDFAISYLAKNYGISKVQVVDSTGVYWWNSVKPRLAFKAGPKARADPRTTLTD